MRYTRSSCLPSSGLPTHLLMLTTNLSMPFSRILCYLASLMIGLLAGVSPLSAQQTPALVTQPVDNSVRTVLPGNVHPLALPQFDQGEAPADLVLHRMLLVLKRGDQQETTLRRLIENQQNKKSPNYHQWLTPEEFGTQFGSADSDIAAVTHWLQASGFQVTQVTNGRTLIEFNGTAGQVRQAFGTAIHKYVVKGESHWANASDPSVPTALAPVIAGVNKLNDFRKKAQNIYLGTYSEKTKQLTPQGPEYTFAGCGGECYAVTPFDFATIYNLSPLWSATPTIDGTGQTIAIVGDSDINPSDATTFWSLFGFGTPGLPPMPTLTVTTNGPDPGFNPDETEGDVDTQWAGAAAPGATIDYVTSEDTETDDGVDLSALYIVDNNVAPVMSYSYGLCEAALGNDGLAFYGTLWEQAAAQGITVMVSTGDSGSAGCDNDDAQPPAPAQNGLAVSGIASTPFNVAVGGTDFNQYNTWSTYWNSTNDATTQESAKGYIPETSWNSSCTNGVFQFVSGGSTNPETNCNNAKFDAFLDPVGGGGGASTYWLTPTWQTGTGVPGTTARYLPDVSLFASSGFISSFYLICQSDVGGACDLSNLLGLGGTSFASPAFAGIMALVNQQHGPQGIANLVLYNLSAKSGADAFHDVPVGSTNAMPCTTGTPNCVTSKSGDAVGVLSGYSTTLGYDLATGLGSVNAANLVNNWDDVTFTPTTTTLALNSGNSVNITHGDSVTVTVSAAPTSGSGTPTGDVAILVNPGTPGNPGIDGNTLSGGTITWPTSLLPGGTYKVIAHYEGDTTYGGSYSSPSASVTVNPENSSVYMGNPPGLVVDQNQTTGADIYGNSVVYGTGAFDLYLLRADVLNSHGSLCQPAAYLSGEVACPTGSIKFTGDTNPVPYSATLNLNSLGYTEDQAIQLSGGSHTLVATYSGDPSYKTSNTTATITVAKATSVINNVETNLSSVNVGQQFTVSATVNTSTLSNTSYGLAPTGTVSFFYGSTQLLGTVGLTPTNGSFGSYNPASGLYTSTPASLAASLTTSIPTAGTYNLTATYSGDGNYTPVATGQSNSAQIVVSGATPSFTIGAIAAVTISAPGQSGTAQVTLTPTGGFTGNVSLACALPAAMTESTCPTVVADITNSNAVTAMVTITTTAPQAAANRVATTGMVGFGMLASVFMFAVPGLRRKKAPLALLLFGLVVLIVSCGGGGGGGGGTSNPGTPAGSYTVTLTGTSGSISQTATFSVTVE